MTNDDAKVNALAHAAQQTHAHREITRSRVESIIAARAAGATWKEIGEAVGMEKSACHQLAARHQHRTQAAA